ncbi:hypothetical protein NLX67_02610 [Domibacillus sp. A3M-37]|uniref:hypothetical protein n=1 Tax=Domibacillus sp. A3M-37 TaxID=2962037 RepID=UPI0020B8D3A1|nr:hypothetical protein [Domibacillus sp. A3M-37]MCP3761282.1 hypothetical protein [Domibacillus sp. A3M-37]
MKQKGIRVLRAVREPPRRSRSCGVSRSPLFPQESASFLLHPVFWKSSELSCRFSAGFYSRKRVGIVTVPFRRCRQWSVSVRTGDALIETATERSSAPARGTRSREPAACRLQSERHRLP